MNRCAPTFDQDEQYVWIVAAGYMIYDSSKYISSQIDTRIRNSIQYFDSRNEREDLVEMLEYTLATKCDARRGKRLDGLFHELEVKLSLIDAIEYELRFDHLRRYI